MLRAFQTLPLSMLNEFRCVPQRCARHLFPYRLAKQCWCTLSSSRSLQSLCQGQLLHGHCCCCVLLARVCRRSSQFGMHLTISPSLCVSCCMCRAKQICLCPALGLLIHFACVYCVLLALKAHKNQLVMLYSACTGASSLNTRRRHNSRGCALVSTRA